VRERIEYRFRVPSAAVFTLYSYSKALEYPLRVVLWILNLREHQKFPTKSHSGWPNTTAPIPLYARPHSGWPNTSAPIPLYAHLARVVTRSLFPSAASRKQWRTLPGEPLLDATPSLQLPPPLGLLLVRRSPSSLCTAAQPVREPLPCRCRPAALLPVHRSPSPLSVARGRESVLIAGAPPLPSLRRSRLGVCSSSLSPPLRLLG
jgi:hypothetical protein